MPSITSTLGNGQARHFSKAETRRHRRKTQERKGKKSRPCSKEPIDLHKSRNIPQIADPAAPGDIHAHEFDDSRLLKKLMPQGQERRGCKSRDVDLRIKRDNKAVFSGVCQPLESEANAYGEEEDFE
ncbi:hypothetical protein N8I77_006304 [Diaporthe amygdali]|uniref:Uncharacterized protein n=1 Tax=Phomopsis amygdali TaxID=1214568 RepID=A0AAD9W3U8_PHOAM|nr:hypothetical protein N8I77_006304 [Diaporthe amygdali]